MNDDTIVFTDHTGREIRLTHERRQHILEHPEMEDQFDKIRETIAHPEVIVATSDDETVHIYHRRYATTPVTRKYLLVGVKHLDNDAFVLTAFFSSRQKKGKTVWQG